MYDGLYRESKLTISQQYWSRAWTVQEVVLARDAVIHCGPHTTSFFNLASILVHPATPKYLNVTYGLFSYLKQTFALRSQMSQDPDIGLFTLFVTASLASNATRYTHSSGF